jgi:hypothetical protein
MLTLPETYCTLISESALVFSKRVWRHAPVLLIGAILAPGKRTVTSVRSKSEQACHCCQALSRTARETPHAGSTHS